MAGKATTQPKHLHAAALTAASVLLSWRRVLHTDHYVIYRDGKRLGSTRATRFNDKRVKPGRRYRYKVRARGKHGWVGPASRVFVVTVPKRKPGPGGGTTPGPNGSGGSDPAPGGGGPAPVGGDPGPGPSPGTVLTQAMVDRMFWRAGFGPSAADRATWTGRTVGELVDHFLDTPQQLSPTSTPPKTQGGGAIDPLASDDELVMEWLDTMQRAQNPFIERLTFFWHRHWAVNRQDGTPAQWMLNYRDLLRSHADLAANPNSTFKALAMDMTTNDGAISFFLTMWANQKGEVNENYAREFMELFCLGVTDANGNANYSQTDVSELARAFTGWRLDQNPG